MGALIWLAGAVLVAAMLVIEILEGHAPELALVGAGLVALACRLKTGPSRPLVGLACATIAVAAVLGAGCTHWFDGKLDTPDWIYAAGVVLAVFLAFAPTSAAAPPPAEDDPPPVEDDSTEPSLPPRSR